MHSLSRMQRRHIVRLPRVAARAVRRSAEGLEAEVGPPPVGQVQQLQREKRAVERQVGRSVEITQEVSALVPVGPLERCGGRLR